MSSPDTQPLDERLAELFAAVEAQVSAPLLTSGASPVADSDARFRRGGRGGRVMLAAAAVVLIVAAGAVASRPHTTAEVRSTAATAPADEVDALADEVCAQLQRDRAGVRPRFDTLDAYTVSARARIDAVDRALAALATLGDRGGSAEPAERATDALFDARTAAESVLVADSVTSAAHRWSAVDPAIDRALTALSEDGAERC